MVCMVSYSTNKKVIWGELLDAMLLKEIGTGTCCLQSSFATMLSWIKFGCRNVQLSHLFNCLMFDNPATNKTHCNPLATLGGGMKWECWAATEASLFTWAKMNYCKWSQESARALIIGPGRRSPGGGSLQAQIMMTKWPNTPLPVLQCPIHSPFVLNFN